MQARVQATGVGAGEILMGVGGKILAPGSKGTKFGITTILFPRGVTIIDGGFSAFPFLETVVLPETLELLDIMALSDCPCLTNIDLNGITRLKVAQSALVGSTPTSIMMTSSTSCGFANKMSRKVTARQPTATYCARRD